MSIKKSLKKLICLAMCVCSAGAAVGAMAGCNKSEGPQVKQDIQFDEFGKPIFTDANGKGITLKVWSVIGSPDNAYLDLVNKSFNDTNKNNGLQAEITSIDTFLFYNQIVNTINTDPDNAPDVIIMHSERLTYHVDQNVLVPVEEVLANLGDSNTFSASNYLENVIAECYAKGKNDSETKLYGVPLDVHSGLWFVRQDILEKNGLTMPTNKAEFEAVCAALMEKKAAGTLWTRDMTAIKAQIDNMSNPSEADKEAVREAAWKQIGAETDFFPVEMSGADNIESGWIPQSAVLQNGGKLSNADGTPAWNNSTGLQSALEMISGWRGKYIGANRNNETLWLNVGNGNAIFGCEGPWFAETRLNEYEKYLGEGSLGILNMSKLYADDANSPTASLIYGVGHAICLTNSEKNASMTRRLAGAMYAQYMTENSTKYTAGGHIPACKKVLESEEYLSSAAYDRYIKYMGAPENYVMLGNTQYFSEVYEQLKMAYIYTLSDNKTGTVLDHIQQCYNTAMESINANMDL